MALALAPLAGAAPPTTFVGTVEEISDGDTLKVSFKVRVQYIDAPEKAQPYGKEATDYLTELLKGRKVVVTMRGKSYDRMVADVQFGEGMDLARHLTELGNAHIDRRFNPPGVLIRAEDDARAEERGLWKELKPVPPWEFRKQRKAPK